MPNKGLVDLTDGVLARRTDKFYALRDPFGTDDDVVLTGDQIFGAYGSHPNYFHHSFAGNQIVGDDALYDISGNLNDGLPGANLSNANLWTNAGYASTVDPAGGTTDSVLRLPNLNFDYAGGEKLILWWLGKVTAEGSATEMMGDGTSTSGPGLAIRINTNNTPQLVLSDGTTNTFSGSGTAIGDGALHAFGLAINGADKTYCLWTDGVTFNDVMTWQSLASGASVDIRNSNTWNIGCARPKAAASTAGIATQTRALAMLRFSPAEAMPELADITRVFLALRRSPNRLIRPDAL